MTAEEILQIMQRLVAEQFSKEPSEISMDTSFEDDLSADSVDLVELVMSMEDEFEIGEVPEDEVAGIKTVGDAVRFLSGKLSK